MPADSFDPGLAALTDRQIAKVLSDAAATHAKLLNQLAEGIRNLPIPADTDPKVKRGSELMRGIIVNHLLECAAQAQQIADDGPT